MNKIIILFFIIILFIVNNSNSQEKKDDIYVLIKQLKYGEEIVKVAKMMVSFTQKEAELYFKDENDSRFREFLNYLDIETSNIKDSIIKNEIAPLYDSLFSHNEIKELLSIINN